MKIFRLTMPNTPREEYEILIPYSAILRIDRDLNAPATQTELHFEGGSHTATGSIDEWREKLWPGEPVEDVGNAPLPEWAKE
jgi:hypothetical protein